MKTKLITLLIAIFALVGSATAQKKIQVYKDGAVAYSEYVSDIDSVKFIELNNGHEYVDLGLSVKWATCNVGATAPEEYGDYFAWGETSPKSDYAWSNYKFGWQNSLEKYTTLSSYGGFSVDYKTIPELEDDAAHVNWGGTWRMPTVTEQDELLSKCALTWITQNGVNGYKVTSNINGNSIFLPAAGYCYGSALIDRESVCGYWSKSLNVAYNEAAYLLFSNTTRSYSRDHGMSVRAVCE